MKKRAKYVLGFLLLILVLVISKLILQSKQLAVYEKESLFLISELAEQNNSLHERIKVEVLWAKEDSLISNRLHEELLGLIDTNDLIFQKRTQLIEDGVSWEGYLAFKTVIRKICESQVTGTLKESLTLEKLRTNTYSFRMLAYDLLLVEHEFLQIMLIRVRDSVLYEQRNLDKN